MAAHEPFDIGLVMAGAVSAGAYTAGVCDFLLQALDEWETAKARGADCPQHAVRIKAVAGASAGGMTAAMLAALLHKEARPITSLPGRMPTAEEAAQNTLYRSWVERIDIASLLGTDDLRRRSAPVRSVLDSTVLEEIADEALAFTPGGPRRPYFAEETDLFLTLTNLRGVPYAIDLSGADVSHPLSLHADHMHFVLSDRAPSNGAPGEGAALAGGVAEAHARACWLSTRDPEHPNWQRLKQAALATGAFPGGLAPRLLGRRSADYGVRAWPIPQASGHAEGDPCVRTQRIPPRWPEGDGSSFDYSYLCVDGGVMDNEPLELARRALAGGAGRSNPRGAENVRRTVIMVDPFPGAPPMTSEDAARFETYDVLNTLLRMVTSLKHQARFKLDELVLAQANDVYSRFLIAPTRYERQGGALVKSPRPIASGVLGGFGGFFSKDFRAHDFQLGRRNCQRFLRKHLVLPLDKAKQNELFAQGDPARMDRHKITLKDEDGAEKDYYPIIPLLESAKDEAHPLRWDTLRLGPREVERLRRGVARRTQAVTSRLVNTRVDGSVARTAAKLLLRFKRGALVDGIMKKIEGDLDRYDLLA